MHKIHVWHARIDRRAARVVTLCPPVGESNALHLGFLGLCEMHNPLVHWLMFRLDSDPEPDTPAPRTPCLNALGLEAMPTPQRISSGVV